MLTQIRLTSLALFLSFAELSSCFQVGKGSVTGDRNHDFMKEAIEKSTGKTIVAPHTTTTTSDDKSARTVSPLVILDDDSYSRQIRQIRSQQHWHSSASSMPSSSSPMSSQTSHVNENENANHDSSSFRFRSSMSSFVEDNKSKFEPLVKPLSKCIRAKFPPRREVMPRKRFLQDDMPTEYWFDNRIHTFGNVGFWGGLHAACAPLATWLIDTKAYESMNARAMIARELHKTVNKTNARVLDLCCGVGMSTRALADVFTDAEFIAGVDTSPEMLSMARLIGKYNTIFKSIEKYKRGVSDDDDEENDSNEVSNASLSLVKLALEIKTTMAISSKYFDSGITYVRGNAERVRAPSGQFDLVTIMYAFHEIPKTARYIILREARRLLKPGGILAVVDIHPTEYTPSATMLAGEPYVIEYQQNIQKQMESVQGFVDFKVKDVVPGHVTMWTRTRK